MSFESLGELHHSCLIDEHLYKYKVDIKDEHFLRTEKYKTYKGYERAVTRLMDDIVIEKNTDEFSRWAIEYRFYFSIDVLNVE